ncbi:hypothetical protein U1Q18_030149 [Sarracenia purpurea var. burkii]
MDAKVKAVIKLIEEDADSFTIRAEMYYKKRPELMKLVEEFYRAYRDLAERYNHAAGELRQAHHTIEEAFPNQVPFELTEDSPLGSSSHELERNGAYSGESDPVTGKKVLTKVNDVFGAGLVVGNSKVAEGKMGEGLNVEKEEKDKCLDDEVSQLSGKNQKLKNQAVSELKHEDREEIEIQNLKKSLADMYTEKEAVLLQYKQSVEKLSNLEAELEGAHMNSRGLNEQVSKAAAEVQMVKEAIVKLEAERDASFLQHNEVLRRISDLESIICQAQEDAKGFTGRAIKAEIRSQYLEKELLRLETEKDAGFLHYKHCLEKISNLEKKLSLVQEKARLLNERAETAENEARKLEKTIAELREEKEAANLQYEQCLEKISMLESELCCAQEDMRRLNSEVLMETAKLKSAEEKYVLLETSNRSLKMEANNLVNKISVKDRELSKKHGELEKLQACVQDEILRFPHVEAALQNLQNLHSRCQEEQRSLALDLKNGLQMFKETEICKRGFQEEIQRVNDENRILNELNLSSTISVGTSQSEILSLRGMKEKLEEEVERQKGQTNSLKQEICHLKEVIKGLNKRYQDLMEQLESVGLEPECIGSFVKDLKDESSKLRQIWKEDREEKEVFFKELDNVKKLLDKNAALKSSLLDLSGEFEGSQKKVDLLQETCQSLNGEKSALVAEKAILLFQLKAITENVQKLLERNTVLETSFSGAIDELEGLRAKSTNLEELCKLCNNETANLLTERNTPVQLDNAEHRLESLEKRFRELEEKYGGLEKEKESRFSRVEELKVSLGVEKQEQASFTLSREARLASLENHIQLLQEETRWRKKEFEEELDNAVNAQFEIFILQKFMEDMEHKNYSLLIECQKHVEASKLTEKLILELEGENLEQQVEAELLLDEIENLRLGIYQMFKALEVGPDSELDEKIGNNQIFIHKVIKNIEDMKCALSNYKDDRQKLMVENSVLLTLLGELRLEGFEIVSEKKTLDQEFKIMTEKLVMVQTEHRELLEMNRQLKSVVKKGEQRENAVETEMERLRVQQGDLQRAYLKLQEEYSLVVEENRSLLKNLSDLKVEKCTVEEGNDSILLETLALDSLSVVFKTYGTEKVVELKLLSEDLHNLYEVNIDLSEEVGVLRRKMEIKEQENLEIKDSLKNLEVELLEVRDFNNQLRQEISTVKNFLCRKEMELSVTEEKLKAAEDLNAELCSSVEGYKRQHEESVLVKENLERQVLELSEKNVNQKREIKCLHEVKGNLESELGILHEEIKKRRMREESLSSELQERSNKFEILEDEASTFHFDLQISTIREVLFENKVRELNGVCKILQNESTCKTVEIGQMKERVSFMEIEIGGLKEQLFAYGAIVESLKDNITSLEHNILSKLQLTVEDNQKPKEMRSAVHLHARSCPEIMEDHKPGIPNGSPELQGLQSRIKAVEKIITEEMKRLTMQTEELKSNYHSFILEKDREIKCLHEVNENLVSELGILREEIKRQRIREESLSSELQVTSNKFEVLEAEATMVYFDLQISTVREVSFENKVHELSGVCEILQNESSSKSVEIEQMRERVKFTETEIGGLKAQLFAYGPIIESLKDTVASLEHNILSQPELTVADNQQPKEVESVVHLHAKRSQELMEDHMPVIPNVIPDLQDLQSMIKAVEQTIKEEMKRLAMQRSTKAHTSTEDDDSALYEFEDVEQKSEDLSSKLKVETEMGVDKLEISRSIIEPNQEENKKKSLEGLDFDAQKSKNLQTKGPEIRRELEMEEAASVQRNSLSDLEVQKIHVLLKQEGEKKRKGKSRFSRIETSIFLRTFILGGRRSGTRPRRARLCGCGCFRLQDGKSMQHV